MNRRTTALRSSTTAQVTSRRSGQWFSGPPDGQSVHTSIRMSVVPTAKAASTSSEASGCCAGRRARIWEAAAVRKVQAHEPSTYPIASTGSVRNTALHQLSSRAAPCCPSRLLHRHIPGTQAPWC